MARRLVRRSFTILLTLAAGAAPFAVGTPAQAAPVNLNVRDFGATGNGSTNDTAAINRAITAANAAADGGIVRFPPGTYRSANSIHMRSDVTLQLDAGATIMGASGTGYDAPEPNPNDNFQDFGHSHFHNAMIWGDRLSNIGFVGAGTIDGGGNLITGNPTSGHADKIISLTRCNNLTLSGIRLRRGGHFAALINGCDTVTSDHLVVDTASDRDGWNIISTTNVTITNANIAANDDALVFKSDYALGAKMRNGNVSVTDSRLSAGCCNALMFGSETCGDFTGYDFQRITITGANKSGLGMVSMDGANISDVHYRDITMTGVASPIMQKIGTRRRCGNSPGVGHIRNITYDNITGTGKSSPQFSPTLWGESGGNRISDVTFNNVNITVPGGSGSTGTGVPSNDPNNYNPNSIGKRPAYGWYIHNADNIRFNDSSVQVSASGGDARPAVIANAGSTVNFRNFRAERSTGSNDMTFQNVNPFCVAESTNTSGGALRISTSGSTSSCAVEPPPSRLEAENATISGGVVESNHAGFSGTGFVNYNNEVGGFVEWTVNRDTAGPVTLRIGYANGTTTNRPMDISVGGGAATAVNFPGTGAWTSYSTATVTVNLAAGANKVRATATTAGGGPNVDYLDVG
jgi:polygalacturonase